MIEVGATTSKQTLILVPPSIITGGQTDISDIDQL